MNASDGLYAGHNTSCIRPLDKLNIDLSDLLDDLVGLANSDTGVFRVATDAKLIISDSVFSCILVCRKIDAAMLSS